MPLLVFTLVLMRVQSGLTFRGIRRCCCCRPQTFLSFLSFFFFHSFSLIVVFLLGKKVFWNCLETVCKRFSSFVCALHRVRFNLEIKITFYPTSYTFLRPCFLSHFHWEHMRSNCTNTAVPIIIAGDVIDWRVSK